MKMSRVCAIVATLGGVFVAVAVPFADGTRFSDFTPLAASAGPTADEAAPITLGNPDFEQESVADRITQLAEGAPNTGAWDMITSNESGPHKGRYLFTVFETGQAGIQRTDLRSGTTDTIWNSPWEEDTSPSIRPTGLRGERSSSVRKAGVTTPQAAPRIPTAGSSS